VNARGASAVFFGWLVVSFFVVSVVTIYGFDYFEGALGSRADNLMLSVVLYTGVALAITAGCAAVLVWGSSSESSFRVLHLAIAAAIACALDSALGLVGPLLDYLGSWEAKLVAVLVYSALVGVVVGVGLLRFSKATPHAA
jgi:hypothetical protein